MTVFCIVPLLLKENVKFVSVQRHDAIFTVVLVFFLCSICNCALWNCSHRLQNNELLIAPIMYL